MTSQKCSLLFFHFYIRVEGERVLRGFEIIKLWGQYEICGFPAGNKKPKSHSALCRKMLVFYTRPPPSPQMDSWLKKDLAGQKDLSDLLKIPHTAQVLRCYGFITCSDHSEDLKQSSASYHTWITVLGVRITRRTWTIMYIRGPFPKRVKYQTSH